MTEIFTTGSWRPNPGKEDAFVEAWVEFANWASSRPGVGRLRLTRDVRDSEWFVSFGGWESVEAVRAWKSAPEFSERLAHVVQHVAEFEPTELEVVATADSGTATLGAAATASSRG